MKPTVIYNAAADSNGRPITTSNNAANNPNGVNIPINHQYGAQPQSQQQSFAHDPNAPGYSSPSNARQFPSQFQQGFGLDPHMDDMFSDTGIRSRLGRMHDPFATFGSRKRCGNEPQANDSYSRYFDDDADFFPQFGTLGSRRRAAAASGAGGSTGGGGIPTIDPHLGASEGHDFFDRLPSEFRQYIPEGFGMGHRRTGSGGPQSPRTQQQQMHHMPQQHVPQPQYYPTYVQPDSYSSAGVPHSPQEKKLCDAAIQTEDPSSGRRGDMVDGNIGHDNLNQHGLRNTVDLGVKSAPENDNHGSRSHSAPPNEQQSGTQKAASGAYNTHSATQRNTPPPQQQQRAQFSTQTSPQVGGNGSPHLQQQAPFQKAYYTPQKQANPQGQNSTTPPPPTTPGGSYIRTIPIFVEGRSEPIINSHKEIPNQQQATNTSSASPSARPYAAPSPSQQQQQQQHQHHQQYRPTPLNTHQTAATQEQQPVQGLPPQTPHTLESINKIQDIQRDVLALMSKVEKFAGTRKDKEYAYLDEMLTRNLLKLDTIDTNGKESIRMARKEAIKCIQASINVLEAKAEENAKTASQITGGNTDSPAREATPLKDEPEPADGTKIQGPIPLPPPPESHKNTSADKEPSPAKDTAPIATATAAPNTSTSESTETKMVSDAKTE